MTTPPHLPTEARPGTPDKIRVLQRRASRRLPLFVEGDAVLPAVSGDMGWTETTLGNDLDANYRAFWRAVLDEET